ncbi:MFS transporter [Krasilnikovia sp. MM14-A1004]|uniref:MFS transporter n=1 Tax=Krasilnikovia sp. MM14-A1004 TaxID=3373541 RepID=UPI00399CDBB7
MTGTRDTIAPLRLAGYRGLLLGRTINAVGNAFAPIALAFAVLDLTGSASDLGLVVGTRTLVNVLFVLFGGMLADRLPKTVLMVGAAVAAATTQAAVAALVLTGTATVPMLIGLSALNGMVAALSMPATSAIIAQLVPEDLRQQANGLNRLAFNSAAIIGAPVGGTVVAAVGTGWGILVDSGTFLLAAFFFARLPVPADAPAPAATAARPTMIVDLRVGWGEFISRSWLWVGVAGACVGNLLLSGGILVLGPVIADETFGRQPWGFVLAAETAGMIIGALIAIRLRLRRLLLFGVTCVAAEALPLFTLGVYPHLGAVLAAAFVAGLAIEQFGIAWETTLQTQVPVDRLARVYSYDTAGSFVAVPSDKSWPGRPPRPSASSRR